MGLPGQLEEARVHVDLEAAAREQEGDAREGAGGLAAADMQCNADAQAAGLDYIPLPATLKAMVRKSWAAQVKGPDGKPVYVAH